MARVCACVCVCVVFLCGTCLCLIKRSSRQMLTVTHKARWFDACVRAFCLVQAVFADKKMLTWHVDAITLQEMSHFSTCEFCCKKSIFVT